MGTNTKRKGINYTAEDFYTFGKTQLSKVAIAKHYKVSNSAVNFQFKKPHFNAAFQAGRNGEPFPSNSVAVQTPVAEVAETIASSAIVMPSPEDLKYAEIERRILFAIDEHFCTEWGIKNHAGFERSFDISEILNGMVAERLIRREKASDVTTAYFRFNWKVKRYWRDGTAQGKVGIEFEQGDGCVSRDPKSIGIVKTEIYQKLREISELLQSL